VSLTFLVLPRLRMPSSLNRRPQARVAQVRDVGLIHLKNSVETRCIPRCGGCKTPERRAYSLLLLINSAVPSFDNSTHNP
jgi:hypothetical protein